MRLIAAALLACTFLKAQVLTVDTSGNINATGTYSSGVGATGPGKITLNGTTSGSVRIRVDTTPLTYNWLIPNSASPTNGQFLTFGTPSGGDVPISYRTIVSGDLPVNLTESSGASVLPNPTFNRVTAGNPGR